MKTHTHCPHCGAENHHLHCSSCDTVLAVPLHEIQLIREEVRKLEAELGAKSKRLFQRLYQLENSLKGDLKPIKEEKIKPKPSALEATLPLPTKPISQNKPLNPQSSYSTTQEKIDKSKLKSKSKVKEEKGPAEIPLFLQVILAPLMKLLGYAQGVYKHYKIQGRLPVFFLSLGGIIAILFGVGYLMQLGFSYFLDILSAKTLEGIKILLALAGSSLILGLGIRFSKKENKYQEFAAALMGLAIGSYYLIFYFLPQSSYFPVFANGYISLLLIACTAFCGSLLALKHETRVLALVSYLGAALIPIFMQSHFLGEFYVLFLFLLTFAQIFIARKIAWQALKTISLLLSIGVLEWLLFAAPENFAPSLLLIALHAFAYLFIISTIWRENGLIRKLNAGEILFISSSLSLLILNALGLAAMYDWSQLVGWIFIGNLAIWGVFCGLYFKSLSEELRWLCFLIGGIFLTLSAVLLLDQNYLALGLGLEVLLLINFGFRFSLPKVRMEAFALLILVLFRCVYGMKDFTTDWQASFWSDSFMHLLILGGLLAGTLFSLKKFTAKLEGWEADMKYVFGEALFIWSIGSLLLSLSRYTGIYTYNIALLPMIFMIYWGIKQKLPISERVGWMLGFAFLIGYGISANEVGSLHFYIQSWPAKLAGIELFAMLYLLQYFYKEWADDSALYIFTKYLRRGFFVLLPLVFLPGVARRFPEYLPYAAWASFLISYGIAKIRKAPELLIETHILAGLATILMFNPLRETGVLMGVCCLGLMYIVENAHRKEGYKMSPFQLVHTYSFIFLALAIVLALLKIEEDYLIILPGILSIYFWSLYYFRSSIPALKFRPILLQFFLGFNNLLAILLLSFIIGDGGSGFFNLANLLVFLIAVYLTAAFYGWREKTQHLGKLLKFKAWVKARFIFIQILTWFCYAAFWSQLSQVSMGMGLTISMFLHAILLLFFSSLKNRHWIQRIAFTILAIAFAKLILFDFRHFALVYKVGVSILSGALMLGGARMYLRREMA